MTTCPPATQSSHPSTAASSGSGAESRWVLAQGRAKLQELAHLKEAEQLLRSMLTFKPKGRPSMRAVMSHPFWWPPAQRLSFLIDMSDRMENEDREVGLAPDAMHPSPRGLHCTWPDGCAGISRHTESSFWH